MRGFAGAGGLQNMDKFALGLLDASQQQLRSFGEGHREGFNLEDGL